MAKTKQLLDYDKERTFQYQNELPNLPVPSLEHTLKTYIDSVKPFLSDVEYGEVAKIVLRFGSSTTTKALHKELVEKSKKERNWLERWWEDEVYLKPRYPILPLVNFGGFFNRVDYWPPQQGTQHYRGAFIIHLTLRFWCLLREERIPVQRSRGQVLCMNQLRRVFNTCRIPGAEIDEFRSFFCTKAEGSAPSHVSVFVNGHFWQLETHEPHTGRLYTPPEIEKALVVIHQRSRVSGPFINAMTCHDRTSWFHLRQHLISLGPEQESLLHSIESSVAIFVLTAEMPANENEHAWHGCFGHPRTMWADKAFLCHIHKNGLIDNCCDHGPADAIAPIMVGHYLDQELLAMGYQWQDEQGTNSIPPFSELKFVVDDKILAGIEESIEVWRPLAPNLDILLCHFDEFGNDSMRKAKVYGDTIVQLALQLAYYRLYHVPPATYETAMTRKFYNGRTETVRSCTSAAICWTKSVLDPQSSDAERLEKLRAAISEHNRLMANATNNAGCDRHLLGLRLLYRNHGLPEPELFQHSSWKLSGGDGNFTLSTSFEGYTQVYGGCAPMIENGYGVFYKMAVNEITLCLTAWKTSGRTDVKLFESSIFWSLRKLNNLLHLTGKSSL